MRVVSGTCKGRSLKPVPGHSTRPTADKVKEAIFNMIGPYFEGGKGLDLFAGSGNLGIEALSRGLGSVVFVDRDGKAVHVIKENIKACGLEERAEIYRNDAERALKALNKREARFDCIFLDPPYNKQQLVKLLEILSRQNLVSPSGIIVCEHSADVQLPAQVGSLLKVKDERYGMIAISIYTFGSDEQGVD